jgi:outer membrane protein, heavy metal efflux system
MTQHSVWKFSLPLAWMLILLPAGLAAQVIGTERPRMASPGAASAAAPGLTLEQLQQIAIANNPTLGQAQANVTAAGGRTRQAGLLPNPTVGYIGEEIRGGSFGGGQQGVFVQQNVILGGKLGLDRKVFAAEGKQAEAEAEEQRLRVANGVRIAFYQSLAAQQMIEVRTKVSAFAGDAVETTRQLFNVGQSDEPDVLQAQVEADQAALALTMAEQEQQRAWRVLAATVGQPELSLAHLEGDLEDLPDLDAARTMETILSESPAVKIAQLGIARAGAEITRAHRELIPDLSLRAGYLDNRERLETGSPTTVGSEAFAEVGLNLRLFNRNQGNIQAAKADEQRANLEVQRVSLVLRQMAAPILENYSSYRAIAARYKSSTLPHARQAYELYLGKYREGAAAYPQVLISQRTLFQLEASYITALENAWINAATLQGMLLTDGLHVPASSGEFDRPVREINLPIVETPGGQP